MRKAFICFTCIISLCIGAIFLTSCEKEEEAFDFTEVKEEIKSAIPQTYVKSMDLPITDSQKLTTITWTSSNQDIISNTGKLLKRPTEVVSIDLSYTITYQNQGSDGVITVKVSPFSIDDEITWVKSQISKYVFDDIELPTKSKYGEYDITWESSEPKYLKNNGEILRLPKQKVDIRLDFTLKNDDTEESSYVDVELYPKSIDAIAQRFESGFPQEIGETIDFVVTEFYGIYTVTWESTNTEVLKSDGTYIKPATDTPVIIKYRVQINEECYGDYEMTVNVLGVTNHEKASNIYKWITTEKLTRLDLEESIELPTTDPFYNTEIKWDSVDPTIIDNTGKITRYVCDRYVELICELHINNLLRKYSFWIVVKAVDISDMSQTELLEEYFKIVAKEKVGKVTFLAYPNLNQSFNSLQLFNNTITKVNQNLTPTDEERRNDPTLPQDGFNRPGIIQTSTQFIVVHDTANTREGANALAHSTYVKNGGGGASYQYVVGNDGIYQNIPDNEVAYHAGDGSRLFGLNDTGIKATSRLCNIGIDSEGYYTFNGVSSNVHIPEGISVYAEIAPSGIYYTIGENGNWWINNTYYNSTYGVIANQGGNRNSIGIETCVDKNSDYLKTLKFNTNLVANLCIKHNLDILQIMQHNNMSGKDCPNAMRAINYWQVFRDRVSIEKFGLEHFEGLTITWTSNSSILSNDGFITRNTEDFTEVKYCVEVKQNDQVIFGKTYTTTLIK